MKKITAFLLLILLASCEFDSEKIKRIEVSGDIKSSRFQLQPFHGLVLAGPMNLVLQQDGGSELYVETYESILEQLHVEVVDEVLYLYIKDSTAKHYTRQHYKTEPELKDALKSGSRLKWPKGKKVLNLVLSFSEIDELQIVGEADIRTQGLWKGEELSLVVAGALHLEAGLQMEELSVEVAGAANMELQGSCRTFNFECAGASSLKAYEFFADTINMEIAGASNADIYAAKSLDVSIAGIGDIHYKGNPSHLNIDKAGLGKVRQVEEERESKKEVRL